MFCEEPVCPPAKAGKNHQQQAGRQSFNGKKKAFGKFERLLLKLWKG